MRVRIGRVSMLSKRGRCVQLIRHLHYSKKSLSTFHKDIQSESRLMNKAVLWVEFKSFGATAFSFIKSMSSERTKINRSQKSSPVGYVGH